MIFSSGLNTELAQFLKGVCEGWGEGGGRGKESYFENVKWNQKRCFKNENLQTLIFQDLDLASANTPQDSCVDFIFLRSFFFSSFPFSFYGNCF